MSTAGDFPPGYGDDGLARAFTAPTAALFGRPAPSPRGKTSVSSEARGDSSPPLGQSPARRSITPQSNRPQYSSTTESKDVRDDEDSAGPSAQGSARDITLRAMTMRRHRKADTIFRSKFGIPEGELFLDEYHCALQKKMLIQGRMYIFEHFVTFYANIFGVQKVKVMALKDVTAVRKAKTLGLPNAIEITHRGKVEFFTSFLSRDEAYRVVCSAWGRTSAYAKLYLGAQALGSSPSLDFPAGSQPRASALGTAGSQEGLLQGGLSSVAAMAAALAHGETDREDEDDEGDSTQNLRWAPQHGQPPPPREELKSIATSTLQCSAETVCSKFLSSESGFWEKLHHEFGDTDVTLSDWQHDAELGMVRSLEFVRHLGRVAMGPDKTRCSQTQRCRQYLTGEGGAVVLFETEQEMMDIPFGDTFKVVLRWEFHQHDESVPETSVSIMLGIPFSKSCWVKGMIASRTTTEVTEATQKVLGIMAEAIAPPRPEGTASSKARMLQEFKKTVTQRVQGSTDVRALIAKIPSEYRTDVMRMLEFTVDQSLTPDMVRHVREGGVYGLVADGADLVLSTLSWVLASLFRRPMVGLSLSREDLAQVMGALLQGLVLLQSSIFLVMFFFWGWRLQGGFPHAPPALLQVAPSAACEAHAAQLQALTREVADLHRFVAALAEAQPTLVKAIAAALNLDPAVPHA